MGVRIISDGENAVLIEALCRHFDYCPKTGLLHWRVPTSNRVKQGQLAGAKDRDGYYTVHFMGRSFQAHRIIWAICNGKFPCEQIDHRDGDTSNNRLSNLRIATQGQQSRNSRLRRDNQLGLKGVHSQSNTRRYRSRIRVDGRTIHLGYFDTPQQAHDAYRTAAAKYHGEFAKTSNIGVVNGS